MIMMFRDLDDKVKKEVRTLADKLYQLRKIQCSLGYQGISTKILAGSDCILVSSIWSDKEFTVRTHKGKSADNVKAELRTVIAAHIGYQQN